MQLIPTRVGRVAVNIVGDGPPLVLLHSVAHDHHDFDAIVPTLSTQFRTIAVDWPGHGESDMFDPPSSAGALRMCDALEDVVDALHLPPAVFLGNSVGGTASLRLAVQKPERVRALVLVDTGGLAGKSALIKMACWVQGRELVRRWTGLSFARSYLKKPSERVDALLGRIEAARARSGFIEMDAAMWRSFGSPEVDMSDAARVIACPTLIVWGKHDPVIRAKVEGRRAREILAHAKYVELDTGHVPFVEDPAAFLDAVFPFLRAIPALAKGEGAFEQSARAQSRFRKS